MLYFDCLFHNLHDQKNCALFLREMFRDMIIIKLSIYCAYGEFKNHVHFTMKNLINVGYCCDENPLIIIKVQKIGILLHIS